MPVDTKKMCRESKEHHVTEHTKDLTPPPTSIMHLIVRACEKEKKEGNRRPAGMSKPATTRACMRSLGTAVEQMEHLLEGLTAGCDGVDMPVTCTVIGDRLSEDMDDFLCEVLPVTEFRSGEFGNDDSLRAAFGTAGWVGESGRSEIIYMVEDDYLHHPMALVAMTRYLRENPGRWIHPTDYPDFYSRDGHKKYRIQAGPIVHWRACRSTTFTFAGVAERFHTYYDTFLPTCRNAMDKHLSSFLRGHGGIVCPIPTLAAHWQTVDTLPPLAPRVSPGGGEKAWTRMIRTYRKQR